VALKETLAAYGPPEIFNTNQGVQFTASGWIDELKEARVKISMDGKGRGIYNRTIEHLWRLLNRASTERNMSAVTCASMRPGHKPGMASANGWSVTPPSGPTRPMAS